MKSNMHFDVIRYYTARVPRYREYREKCKAFTLWTIRHKVRICKFPRSFGRRFFQNKFEYEVT